MESKYALELVSPTGVLLADLTGRASNRRVVLSRNEAEEISWTINLDEFEKLARDLKTDPKLLLITNQTEVRIRRGHKYLAGGQLTYHETRLDPNPRNSVIQVRATGFLNLFKSRFTAASRIFTATQGPTIAWTLINETQSQTNGDFGVTLGPNQATPGVHDRTYLRTNLKDALQALTTVQTAAYDMEFTYDKKFNTYTRLGSDRPEVVFEYPRNIKNITVPSDGTGVANRIIALGSGFGDSAGVQYTADDTASQGNYKVREKIIQSNGTDNTDNGLTDAANTELAAWGWPFSVPTMEVDGNVAPFVTDYTLGDRVRVRVRGHQFLSQVDTMYRIERLELNVDEDDNETVKQYLSA